MAEDLGSINVNVQPDDAAFESAARRISESIKGAATSAASRAASGGGSQSGGSGGLGTAAAGALAGSRFGAAATAVGKTASAAGAAKVGGGVVAAATAAAGGPVGVALLAAGAAVTIGLGLVAKAATSAARSVTRMADSISRTATELAAFSGEIARSVALSSAAQIDRQIRRANVLGGAAARNTQLRSQLADTLLPLRTAFEKLRLRLENVLIGAVDSASKALGGLGQFALKNNQRVFGATADALGFLERVGSFNPIFPQLEMGSGFLRKFFRGIESEIRGVRRDMKRARDGTLQQSLNRELLADLERLSGRRFDMDRDLFGVTP